MRGILAAGRVDRSRLLSKSENDENVLLLSADATLQKTYRKGGARVPKVSVYICTFNRAEMLRESIQSVLNQTYTDMKIIVLDNASEDHTADVVASFTDPRLSYIRHEKNIGTENWNYAFEHVDTEYMCIFHDDDRMFPWLVEEEVKILDEMEEVGLVASSSLFVMDSGSLPKRKKSAINGLLFYQNELIEYVCEQRGTCPIVCPSVVMRSEKINKLALRFRPDTGVAGDFYFWLEANSKGVVVYLFKQPLLETRVHSSAGTSHVTVEHWRTTYHAIEEFIVGLKLGYDMQKLRANFAATCIASAAKNAGKLIDLRKLLLLRESLKEKNGWVLDDDQFNGVLIDAESSILDLWKRNFSDKTDRTLAIYGIGKHTESILSHFTSDNIVGLMDGTRTGGNIYGKSIISMEEAVGLGVDMIVIVALPRNTWTIYRRISDVCTANAIEVYDITGEKLAWD